MLQNHPHTFHIIAGITPVTQRIDITHIQFFLHTLSNACYCQRDFTGNKSFTASFAFMIEKYAVNGVHPIGLAIVFCNPVTIEFGHTIRTARVKRCGFFLRYLLHQPEQFGGGCLVDAGTFF